MLGKLLLTVVTLGAVVGLSVLTAVCASAGMTWVPEKSDCIIVLGAHVWMDGSMSNVLTYRCQAALDAWKNGVAPNIIVCGGQGHNEPAPEAEVMRAWMLKNGVPGDRVFSDPTSVNTQENLAHAHAIMDAQGFSTCVVCTTNYHLRRAMWLARDEGLKATGIAAPSTTNPVSFVRGRLRETCSWILYFVRKHVLQDM